jgi:hypothetical protein
VSRLEINRAGNAVVEGFFPTGHANAPSVARLKPGKFPFRMRCDQVVSLQHGKIEERASYLRTHRVESNVAGASFAKAIAIESGERITAATLQLGAEDICGHEGQDNAPSLFVIPSAVEESLDTRQE